MSGAEHDGGLEKPIGTEKEKRYLAYGEVNDLLPGDIAPPDELQDLMDSINTAYIDKLNKSVLVVVEHKNGTLSRTSLEALAAGQALAKMLGAECAAAVLGEGVAPLAGELSGKALSKVYAVEHPLLKDYTADGYVYALEQVVKKIEPAYVLFPHTYQVRDFAPALATRFQPGLLPDVIAIHDGPVFVRQLFQGKAQCRLRACGRAECAGPMLRVAPGGQLQGGGGGSRHCASRGHGHRPDA